MPLLEIQNLVKKFPVSAGFFGKAKEFVHAVNGVSFTLEPGKSLGLVGESGCGKSTLARCILRLQKPDSGKIFFEGQEISTLRESKLRPLRKNFQMIFQDPYSSLNPKMNIEAILSEGLKIHRKRIPLSNRRSKVLELLEQVGLPRESLEKYPHEFSGGQRQRIGIARALSLTPKLIICDEPVSALDVSVQAQILNLLLDLKSKFHLSYLFISHDLKIVRQISDQIAVMYLGEIVEIMESKDLLACRHPYTQALLAAVPKLKPRREKLEPLVKGEIPSPIDLPSGCVFHPRCPFAEEVCKREVPVLTKDKTGHPVACHLVDKIPTFELKK